MAEKISAAAAEPSSLRRAVDEARAFLQRGKRMAEPEDAYVGRGIGVIRKLKETSFQDRSASAALQRDARAQLEEMVRRLSERPLDVSDVHGRRCADILAHYRAALLADDTSLAKEFESYRAEYLKNPTDAAACKRYGWMLHDCLKAAYDRLHNAQLAAFFKTEFEAWRYQGPEKFRDVRLEECRQRDIKNAWAFLNGPREALVLLAAGKWEEACKSAGAYLTSNPGNEAAFEVMLKACEKIDKGEIAVVMMNAATAAISWHPQNGDFQRWFIKAAVRIWRMTAVSMTPQNKPQWGMIVRWGCGELVRQCCANFQRLNRIAPGTAEYSWLMHVVVSSSERMFRLKGNLRDLLVPLAPMVVWFVRAWGFNNFRPEDKVPAAKDRNHDSLAGRAVIVLLKYCEYGVSQNDLDWVTRLAYDAQHLFKHDATGFLNAMASFYHAYRCEDLSRRFAIDLVRCNPAETWRWKVLARTFPQGSQEYCDCYARALSQERRERRRRLDLVLAQLLGKSTSDATPCQERGKPSLKAFGIQDAERNRRTERILQGNSTAIPGVIQTRFTDKVSGDEMLRMWWRDPKTGAASSDFVNRLDTTGLVTQEAGSPVTVSVVDVGGRKRVVGVTPRTDGTPWDIYPYSDAVVVVRNEARRFARIMYGAGRVCLADLRKITALSALQVGASCQVAVWEREGQTPLALDVKVPENFHPSMSFCRAYSGRLQRVKGSRDGAVNDVRVPPEARGSTYFDTQVRGLAVASGDAGKPSWTAVTCQPLNDLEVLQ